MIPLHITLMQWQRIAPLIKILSCLLCTFTTLILPAYGGIALMITATITVFTANHLFTVILGLLNVSLAIAFDYFLRAHPNGFEFYRQNSISASHLLITTTILYLAILIIDGVKHGGRAKIRIEIKMPRISRLLFYPLLFSVIWCIYFVTTNGSNIFSRSFSLDELAKFPFLEYFSIVVIFLILAAKQAESNRKLYAAVFLSAALVTVLLLSSYRMVAVITTLALIISLKNNSTITRSHILLLWLIAYPGLAAISYYRQGVFDISLANIFGYQNGFLDNTFTGVIETALIYISTSAQHDANDTIRLLAGVLAPLPNTLIPDSFLYHIDVYERYRGRIPGGGLLSGFIVYFDYLLAPFVILYIYFSCKRANHGIITGAMYIISTITITRWWLYGPYVLFKFFGFFLALTVVNKVLLLIEKNPGRKHAHREQSSRNSQKTRRVRRVKSPWMGKGKAL